MTNPSSHHNPAMSYLELPYEIIFTIGLSVPRAGLSSYLSLSRSFHSVSKDLHFWRERLYRDFPGHDVSEIPLDQSCRHYIHLVLSQWRQQANSLINDIPDDDEYNRLDQQEKELKKQLGKIHWQKVNIQRDYERTGYRLRAKANLLELFRDSETYYDVRLTPAEMNYVDLSIPGDWETARSIERYIEDRVTLPFSGLELRNLIGFSLDSEPSSAIPKILVYITDEGYRSDLDYDNGHQELPSSLIQDMDRHGLTLSDIKRIYQLPFDLPGS